MEILAAGAFWTLLCVAMELLLPGRTRDDHDVKNRYVSILHGQIGLWLAFRCLCIGGLAPRAADSAEERRAMAISLGYFLYDLPACLLLGIWDRNLLAHHALAIAGFGSAYAAGRGAPAALLGLLAAEASNLPMHLRQVLRLRGLGRTRLFALSERLYLLSYIASRATLCPLALLLALRRPAAPAAVTLSCLLLTAQSFLFFPRMLVLLRRSAAEARERRAAGVELWWFAHNAQLGAASVARAPGPF